MVGISGVDIVRDAPKQGRKNRNPRHTFITAAKPFCIQPFFIAPVLAGETLKSLLVQAKVEGPLVNAETSGWWCEMYFFYIKHRDLADRELITEMHLNPNADMGDLIDPPSVPYYHAQGINWQKLCLDRVVEEYFRNEGEPINSGDTTSGGLNGNWPLASLKNDTWTQSMIVTGATVDNVDGQLPGEDGETVEIPDGVPAQFQAHWEQWQNMRALKLTEATFEDYLKSFGVSVPDADKPEFHRPELIRYVADWTLPSVANRKGNLVVPASDPPVLYEGVVSGFAPRWAISERADKDRFFKEPGFLFGVHVVRPKVYMGATNGAAVGLMTDAFAWLPAVLSEEAYTSLRKIDGESDITPDVTEESWVDIKDLFVHGDQFIGDNVPSVPSASVPRMGVDDNVQKRYPTAKDIGNLLNAFDKHQVFTFEGVISLTVASRVVDTSL